jgi:hypothetical protein
MSRPNRKQKGNGRGASREAMLAVRGLAPHAPNLRHAAFVRITPEMVDAITGEVVRTTPWLGQPRYRALVTDLARVEARLAAMDQVLSQHPKAWVFRTSESGKLEVSQGERHYISYLEQKRRLLESAGLTPAAAKQLGLPIESPDEKDLDALLAEAAEDDGDGEGKR